VNLFLENSGGMRHHRAGSTGRGAAGTLERMGARTLFRLGQAAALSALLACASPAFADDTPSFEEGQVVRTTREAILNGVTMAKGTELRIAALKKDASGAVARIDLQQVDGEKKLFKAITLDALVALTSQGSTAPSGDRASVFKVAAQIPLMHDLLLGGVVFPKGTVLQVDKVLKDKKGKVAKVDLRETTGQKRLLRSVIVEKLMMALSPDDITWPDGAPGQSVQLAADLTLGEQTFVKGTKLVVTKVETEPKTGGVVKVDLRESEGQKREALGVSVAVLKQNGALGTAQGAPH
jgi:hypothetical protein